LFPTIFLFHHWFCHKVELIKQKLQNKVYDESRCYPLCCFSTCFLFMFSFVFNSSISLLVFMLTLIFMYCILTFFFFVYHFSCYSFVLFFFTYLLFFVFWLLCRFLLPWPNFLFYCICWNACVLKTLPLCWILLVQNMSSFCCIVFLLITVAMCWFFSCLFLFFYFFLPLLCKFLLLLTHVLSFFLSIHQKIMKIMMITFILFHLLVFSHFFALYFVDACISCNILYLYCILFKCTFLVSLPLKEAFEWKKTSFWKHNWRHIHKTIITIPWIS